MEVEISTIFPVKVHFFLLISFGLSNTELFPQKGNLKKTFLHFV